MHKKTKADENQMSIPMTDIADALASPKPTELIELQRRVDKLREMDRSDGSNVVQLPSWSHEARGLPNALARGGLFSASRDETDSGKQANARRYMAGEVIPTLSNYTILYRGEDLRQDDASVYIQILHLARDQPLGSRIYFTAYSFLKDLKWSVNSRSYGRLKASFERLKANSITVRTKDGSEGYSKSLIRAFYWQNDSGEAMAKWCVELEPDMVKLYGDNTFTLIEWAQRLRIGSRSSLALWLHSFLATHETPMPLTVEKYFELSRSECKKLYHFRALLIKALKRLQDIEFLNDYEVNDADMVFVTRAPRRFVSGMKPRSEPQLT